MKPAAIILSWESPGKPCNSARIQVRAGGKGTGHVVVEWICWPDDDGHIRIADAIAEAAKAARAQGYSAPWAPTPSGAPVILAPEEA